MKKKKLISICLASAILATTFVCSLYPSAADEDFKVSLVEIPVDVGIDSDGNQPDEMPFTIEIRMDDIPNGGLDSSLGKTIPAGLAAVQFAIEFDDSVVTFDSDGDSQVDEFTEGALSDNGAYEMEQSYGTFDTSGSSLALYVMDNRVNVTWTTGLLTKDSAYYLHGSGVLATISGTYDKNATDVSFKIVPITSDNAAGGAENIIDFSVWVDDVSDDFKSYSPALVNLNLLGDGGDTVVYGDVDCDGKSAGITDVVLLSKHVYKKLTLSSTGQNYKNANCNLRGGSADAVDTADLKTLIDVLIGAVSTLPVK
jgi:hypothetical protein